MILISLFIIVIAVIYPFINYRNRFAYMLSLHLIVLSFLTMISVLYFSKTSTYQMMFDIDYSLYLWLLRIKIPLNMLARLHNIGIAAFLLMSSGYIYLLNNTKKHYMFLLLPPLIFLVYRNDPSTVWKIFMYSQLHSSAENLIDIVSNLNTIFNAFVIYIYLLLPFVFLIINYRKTLVTIKKNNIKLYGICIGVINVFFYVVFVNGLFRNILFYNTNEAKLPNVGIISAQFTAFTPMLYIVLLISMGIILLLTNRKFNSYTLGNNRKIFISSRALNKNCNMIFHIYKNAFIGIKRQTVLIQRALKDNSYEKIAEHADSCYNIAESHLSMINKTISRLYDFKLSPGPVKMSECAKAAIVKASIPNDISVIYDIPKNEPLVNADEYHFTEALINIITNAVSALRKKGNDSPVITVKAIYESDYGIIEITDNGIGISNDNIKNIFSIFYSENYEANSSGIGLYYAKNVITQMHGEIEVESEFENYCRFKIALPLYIS